MIAPSDKLFARRFRRNYECQQAGRMPGKRLASAGEVLTFLRWPCYREEM